MNLLERAIATIAPRAALRRLSARARLAALESRMRLGFDAADRGRFTSGWRSATKGSANAESLRGLSLIRYRCRDLARNEPWGIQAVRRLTTLLVGTGFTPRLDGQVEAAWRRWANSRDCDQRGRMSFRALQRQAVRGWIESGEVLIVRRVDRSLEVPLRVQVLEADYLDESRNEELAGGARIVQGIEYDAEGRRRAYWLFDQHPGEPGVRATSRPVPAIDVAHVYSEDRTGQARGLPRLTPCVLKLRDLGDYTEAQLIRQKVAASICYFEVDTDLEAPTDSEAGAASQPTREVQPGTIERLPPGRRVEAPLKIDMGEFRDFGQFTLFEIAAGAGMPYEVLTGDLANVNFSSAKIGQAPFLAEIEELQTFVIVELLLAPVFEWFIDAGRIAGRPGFAAAERAANWYPPSRLVMDPAREGSADVDAVRAGLLTPSEVVARRGRDWREHLDEFKQDFDEIDRRGLSFAIDARKFSPPGTSPLAADDEDPAEAEEPVETKEPVEEPT